MSPNRLALEKSPYLLQHKDNPVDWRPWDEEAFRTAREGDKPLLLSIGYSTCHWCHVMERESFCDPAAAAVMNRLFVCVKLDREERPDVDKVYMAAVHAMGKQGGWPLNVFLTPDLKPFFGGTYFPPEARWGQPGWVDLLERIAQLWKIRRRDIESDALRLSEAVNLLVSAAEAEGSRPGVEALAAAQSSLQAGFDAANGGFGHSPKFPMPAYSRFLLRRHARTGDPAPLEMTAATLRAMARGGVFDQVGGGFHRYSTDAAWRVPHFEKMLYDNAQLLENLAETVLARPDAELSRTLARVVGYLGRDLLHPQGGFFSAEDADSLPPELAGKAADASDERKQEGAFYLWTRAEVDRLLGSDAPAFCARYGVEQDGNAPADPHGEFAGKNIPYDREPEAMTEPAAARARGKLLEVRALRPRPGLDDKILTSWNGLAISGFSRAFLATGNLATLRLAEGAADFLRRESSDESGRRLWHRWRDGDRGVPGMADDYAYLVAGLLDLYEASFDPARLSWALDLAEEAILCFGVPGGGLYQTAGGESPELFARAIEDHDGVEPAASSVLAEAALRLHDLTGREGLRRFADETLERFGAALSERPASMPYMLCALDRALGRPRSVLIAGLDLPAGPELLAVVRSRNRPDTTVAAFTRATKASLARLLPGVSVIPESGRAAAYVCVGRSCGLPLTDPESLAKRLAQG